MSDELEIAPEIQVPETPEVENAPEPVKAEELPAPEPVVQPVRKLKKVIQVNDKDGKPLGPPQTFYYVDSEDLATQLAESVAHGTRRIHELSRKATLEPQKAPEGADLQVEAPIWQPRELTDEEKFIIKTDPEKAFEIHFQAKFGMSSADFAKRQNARDQEARDNYARQQTEIFKDNHPDYVPCAENQSAIIQYFEKHRLAWTAKNLDLAFNELNAGGLLRVRQEVAPEPEPRTELPVNVAPVFPAVIRNSSSRASVPIKVNGPLTPEQLAKKLPDMTDAELQKIWPELRDAR
jgi:hypothetical protein